jgi:hypothetical protein
MYVRRDMPTYYHPPLIHFPFLGPTGTHIMTYGVIIASQSQQHRHDRPVNNELFGQQPRQQHVQSIRWAPNIHQMPA